MKNEAGAKNYSIYLYTLLFCLGVCNLFVCLFVANKRQNSWTDLAQIFCGTSRGPMKRLMDDRIFKNLPLTNSIFENFENRRNFFFSQNFFFFFVLQCTQKELVHNWNRRWPRKAPKTQYSYILPGLFEKNRIKLSYMIQKSHLFT